MMYTDLSQILNYIFGGTTVVSLFIAWKSRKSEIKKAEANALETIQSVYDKLCRDTDRKIDKMQLELGQQEEKINLLHKTVEGYKQKCSQCTHNEIK